MTDERLPTMPLASRAPLSGRLIYHLLPIRRRTVLANLRRAFGRSLDDERIVRLAQEFYAHAARSLVEFVGFGFQPAERRASRVRVENAEAILRVSAEGRGVLVLTGHFGNWEIAVAGGIGRFPQYQGRIHFLRRPLRPHWLESLVTRRFRRAGLGVIAKKGSLDELFDRLAVNDAVIFTFDQHAGGRDGILADFFGHPAWTFRSLALFSLSTGVPVVPAATWREPDGSHVLRFEEALPILDRDDPGEAIRANTQAYNDALERMILRHPEQWFWMHRRWKE
jgi:KDO2-lipid IV(A) lauroyltransferase